MSSHFAASTRSDHPSSILMRRKMLWRSTRGSSSRRGLVFRRSTPLRAEPAKTTGSALALCDWSLGKMDILPLPLWPGKSVWTESGQHGTAANNMHFRRSRSGRPAPEMLPKPAGVAVASLAIGGNSIISHTRGRSQNYRLVNDCVDVCQALGIRVVLLSFGNGDLRDDPAGTDEVVRRLKLVAPKAEKAGVSLGIESWLSAEQHLKILDRVGSEAVRVYYDLCNSTDRGYDIAKEIRQLGKRICEFHAKENGALLGQGNIDFSGCAQPWMISTIQAGFRSRGRCLPASRFSKVTRQTVDSCAKSLLTSTTPEFAGTAPSRGPVLGYFVCAKSIMTQRAFFRRELKLLLIRPARHGQPIARFVVSRLSVNQQHIMVSAIALDVTHGHVPRVDTPSRIERNFLPVREGSDDFDRLRLLRLAVR